jgi:hypothetical protein
LKNPSQKRTGGVAQGVGPEFKPQYCKKKKKVTKFFLDKWLTDFKLNMWDRTVLDI